MKAFNSIKDPVKDKDDCGTAPRRRSELSKVHLSNLPESLAFFSGAIDAAGSFTGIYNSAVLGRTEMGDPRPNSAGTLSRPAHLQGLQHQDALRASRWRSRRSAREGRTQAIEDNPLLSKNIRFYFSPTRQSWTWRTGQNRPTSTRSAS
jgi:NitT/TauT family transport system substrate-binding protein